jgi:FtsZ-binding cell division protein ZapB
MIEITVKVPKNVKDIVSPMGETLYVEALNEVAFKRISYLQKQIEELKEKTKYYEGKYQKDYEGFSRAVPNTVEGHDDWIEWTYLAKVINELSQKIDRLRLLKGE